jgi:hypothetical protein
MPVLHRVLDWALVSTRRSGYELCAWHTSGPSEQLKSPSKCASRTVEQVRSTILDLLISILTTIFAEPIPDISAQVSGPSRWGDAATYFFFSISGLFLGGELGLLSGTASASRTITKDPAARERIEKAFKNYRIDVLKREISALQGKSRFEEFFSG